ncbi:TPA: hypothetical protein ACGPAJ_001768 [Streptococcus suis]
MKLLTKYISYASLSVILLVSLLACSSQTSSIETGLTSSSSLQKQAHQPMLQAAS